MATFTKYSGLNPEVDVTGFDGGIEWFNNQDDIRRSLYPQTAYLYIRNAVNILIIKNEKTHHEENNI